MPLRRFFRRIDSAARSLIDRWRIRIQPFVDWKKHLLSIFIPQFIVDVFPHWVPNAMSACRIVATPFVIWSIMHHDRLWTLVLFTSAALLDLIDGEWARRKHAVSTIGKLLDPLADKILFLPVFVLVGQDLLPAWIFWGIIIPEILLLGCGLFAWLQSIGGMHHFRKRKLGANTAGKLKGFTEVIGTLCLLFHAVELACVAFTIAIIFAILSLFGHFFILANNDHHS